MENGELNEGAVFQHVPVSHYHGIRRDVLTDMHCLYRFSLSHSGLNLPYALSRAAPSRILRTTSMVVYYGWLSVLL